MQNKTTCYFEDNIIQFLTDMEWLSKEAIDLEKMYWATDIATDMSGLGAGDPATVNSALTKTEVTDGYTFATVVKAFFGNASVTQGDYYVKISNILNGEDAAVSVLGPALEDFGDRLVIFCQKCYDDFLLAKHLLGVYNNMKISAVLGQLSNEDVLFGTSLTKSQISMFITLIEQFKKMINNEAVSTADYQSTVDKKPRL